MLSGKTLAGNSNDKETPNKNKTALTLMHAMLCQLQ